MILMYHNIDEKCGINTVSLDNFVKQTDYIRNSGKYNILCLDDYVNNLNDSKIQNPISFSFDDAYVSLTKHVLPVIRKFDIPISVFVPTAYIGKNNVWDMDKNYPEIKILTWSELKELAADSLITIGSHGVNHVSHGKLNEESDFFEITSSRETINHELGIEVKYYSFPFGQTKDISEYSEKNLIKAGYSAALSTIWSRHNTIEDLFRLKRVEILGSDDLNTFIRKTSSSIDIKVYKQKLKNLLYKTKILR